uniref:Uncharacterized protein n=1 Tax=Phaeodactylum tricornutum TaxID=2850 RepID=A0A8J9T4U4_PHATR
MGYTRAQAQKLQSQPTTSLLD